MVCTALVYLASRSWKLVIGTLLSLLLVGYLGMLNGLAIVALAIIFDRVSRAYAKRIQAHLQGLKND
jgi:ABC-type proline/glycine betaine transport system permease subunit